MIHNTTSSIQNHHEQRTSYGWAFGFHHRQLVYYIFFHHNTEQVFCCFFCFCCCCCSSFTEKLNLFVLSKKQRPFLGPPWNATHLYVTVNYIVNRIVCDMVDFISSLAATAQFVRLIVFGKTRFGERARVARVSYRSDIGSEPSSIYWRALICGCCLFVKWLFLS